MTCARSDGAYTKTARADGGMNANFGFTTRTPYTANPVFELVYPTEIVFLNPISICQASVNGTNYTYKCRVEKNGRRIHLYDGNLTALDVGNRVTITVGPVSTLQNNFNIYKGINFETILADTGNSGNSNNNMNGLIEACEFFDIINFNTFQLMVKLNLAELGEITTDFFYI